MKRALFGLALLFAGALSAQEVYTDNVVIVLDASGSMRKAMGAADGGRVISKMEAAKQAIVEVYKGIPDTTHVGLLVFSGEGKRDDWLVPLGPKSNAALLEALDRLGPRGGTPLGKYIKHGADQLLKTRGKQHGYGSYRLLVVTDGAAGDEGLMNKNAREVAARGLQLDVIGVAMAERHSLARIAHSYRRADDVESFKQVVAEVFAEVGGDDAGAAASEQEAFGVLEPLPAGVAEAMIQGLNKSGNHPIGEQLKAERAPQATAQQQPQPVAVPAGGRSQQQDGGGGPTAVKVLLVLAAVVIVGVVFGRVVRS